jgi:hypothetical protein
MWFLPRVVNEIGHWQYQWREHYLLLLQLGVLCTKVSKTFIYITSWLNRYLFILKKQEKRDFFPWKYRWSAIVKIIPKSRSAPDQKKENDQRQVENMNIASEFNPVCKVPNCTWFKWMDDPWWHIFWLSVNVHWYKHSWLNNLNLVTEITKGENWALSYA